MIQKLLIVKNGTLLFNQQFYDCSTMSHQYDLLISSYLTAIELVSRELIGKTIRSVNLDKLTIHFYKDDLNTTVLFILFTDMDENEKDIEKKFKEIRHYFFKDFSNILKNFNGNVSKFQDFNKTLIQNYIVENNC